MNLTPEMIENICIAVVACVFFYCYFKYGD